MSYPPNQPDPQGPGYSQPSQPGQPGQPYGGQAPQQPGGYGQPGGYDPSGGYGQPADTPPGAPAYGPPGQTPMAPGQYGAPGAYGGGYGQGVAMQRPGTVTAGAVLTFIGSGLLVLIGLLMMIFGAAGNQAFAEAFGEASGFATAALVVFGIVLLVIGAIPLVLGIFAFKGSKGALIGLTVFGGLYVLLTLGSLFSGSSDASTLIPLLWVAGATALFWAGRAWYDAPHRA